MQPADLERTVALLVLEDEIAQSPAADSVLLLAHLIPGTSEAPDFSQWLDSFLPKRFRTRVSESLLRAYWAANRRPRQLRGVTSIAGRGVRLIDQMRENTIPATGGIYSVSRIGFSASQDSAIVAVHFVCGGVCGSGNYWLYVREEEGWQRRMNLVSFLH